MDMTMTTSNSKKASSNGTATASDAHHHDGHCHNQQQEAVGMVPEAVDAMNVMQAWKQEAANGGGKRKPRPQLEEALRCPRCDSSNTKFCYYNNKKMSQPRYICKACRRYWTHGGSLRHVPIGGGCRKNKCSSASLSSSSSSSSSINEHLLSASMTVNQPQDFPNVLPTLMSTGFELPRTHLPPFKQVCLMPAPPLDFNGEMRTSSFMDILRGEFLDHQGGNCFYEPTSSGMEKAVLVGLDVTMQHGIVSTLISGGGASAAAHQGGQWPTTRVGPENQQDGGSVPEPTRET